MMDSLTVHTPPIRITDLIRLKGQGAMITCSPAFEVIPVDFTHRSCRFQALVFFCRFSGLANGQQYTFRKCYARGCGHDLCPRVSQAVMIANRYLQRDYQRLQEAGVEVEGRLFTLEESVAKIMDIKSEPRPAMIIEDYIQIAKEGNDVSVDVALEYVPATEHFEYRKNHQTFLLADFTIRTLGKTSNCQRCLGCYPTAREPEEKPHQIPIANDRLNQLYEAFTRSSMRYEKRFFE
jgi:hypothetical protein